MDSPNASDLSSDNASFARIKIVQGPHKGMSYKLISGKITIGRDSKNHIVLDKDKKCSRRQAVIYITEDQNYSIKDLTKKSSVKVNNIIKIQSKLQDGDVIQFGSTILQFSQKKRSVMAPVAMPGPIAPEGEKGLELSVKKNSVDNLSTDPPSPLKLADSGIPPHLMHQQVQRPQSIPYPSPSSAKLKPKSKKFFVILLILGGIAGFLFFSDTPKEINKDPKDITYMIDKEENIKTLTELKEAEDKKRDKNRLMSYQSAQYAYVKGIRDYRKGVYTRAIESFRACKTLYPQHELCDSYLRKAQNKQEQLIQSWMIAGKDYRAKRRFEPCMSSFKNVIQAVKDKSSLVYKEAIENFHICKIQYEDRY